MIQPLIHVYLMPGMAASPKIFEHISLPKTLFKIHLLEWILPVGDELLSDYALRMTKFIKHDNVVLLGVSFGGILVQEMAKHIEVKKVIIVSSVKTKYELPKRMRLAKATGAYKLIPTSIASKIKIFENYAFGKNIKKRLELYKKYLSFDDSKYLSWAIKQVVCWEQESYDPKLIHVHGDKDPVFPIKNIKNCIKIEEATHILIINRYRWFNQNLPIIIFDM